MKSSFLWEVIRRRLVILYRRFRTACRSRLQGSLAGLEGLTPDDGANRLPPKVDNQQPTKAAQQPKRAKTSNAQRRKPEMYPTNVYEFKFCLQRTTKWTLRACLAASRARPAKYRRKKMKPTKVVQKHETRTISHAIYSARLTALRDAPTVKA
jgi:hypothetical protein